MKRILIIFLLASGTFFSCKKSTSSNDITNSPTSVDPQIITSAKKWLDAQKSKSGSDDALYIDSTIKSLQWEKTYLVRLNEVQFGAVVPLTANSATPDKNHAQVLFFTFIDDKGIQGANIWQFKSENVEKKIIGKDVYVGMLEDEKNDFTGFLTLLTIEKKFIVEVEFKNGTKSTFKIISPREPQNVGGRVSDCKEWYYVYYLDDVEIGRQYIGTTCDGSAPCTRVLTDSTGGNYAIFRINCGGNSGGGSGGEPSSGSGSGQTTAQDRLCPDSFIWASENGGYWRSINLMGLRFVSTTNPAQINTFNTYIGLPNYIKLDNMLTEKTSNFINKSGTALDFIKSFQRTKELLASEDIVLTTVKENGKDVKVVWFSQYAATTIAQMAASMSADGVLLEYGDRASIPGSNGPKAAFTSYMSDVLAVFMPGARVSRTNLISPSTHTAHYGICL